MKRGLNMKKRMSKSKFLKKELRYIRKLNPRDKKIFLRGAVAGYTDSLSMKKAQIRKELRAAGRLRRMWRGE